MSQPYKHTWNLTTIKKDNQMTVRRFILCLILSAVFAVGCDKHGRTGTAPAFIEAVPETIVFTSAEAVYYGDDGNTKTSDMWNIRLSDQKHFIQICCNTCQEDKINTDCLEGVYSALSEDGDYSPDTFNPGYMIRIELPDSSIEGPAMSYFAEFAANSSDFIPDLLREGYVSVDINTDGTFTIEGTMIGQMFLKRNFTYTGDIRTIDMSSTPDTKSSNDCRYEIDYEMSSDIMRFDFGVYKAGQCFRK